MSNISEIILIHVLLMYYVQKIRCTGNFARMEEGRTACKILTSKPTGKRPSRIPRHSWEGCIRMDLK